MEMENQGRPIGYHEYKGRCDVEDERFRRDKERLDKQENEMDDVRRLTVQMGEMIKRHDEKIDSHETRLSALERAPSDTLGKIKTAIITAVVSIVITAIFSGAIK